MICPRLYPLFSIWSLRQSGTRTLKFLFAGRNSGHFSDPSTAKRWNIRQNRFTSRRNRHAGVALGVVRVQDSGMDSPRNSDGPRSRKDILENWELIISGEPERLCARGYRSKAFGKLLRRSVPRVCLTAHSREARGSRSQLFAQRKIVCFPQCDRRRARCWNDQCASALIDFAPKVGAEALWNSRVLRTSLK